MTADTPITLSYQEIDALPAKIDFEIVVHALQLALFVDPIAKKGAADSYKNKLALREMDKVLMEWIRQGLSKAP